MNTCKTIGCPSFKINKSRSYRLLKNDEVLCLECGKSFYYISNSEFNQYNITHNKDIYHVLNSCHKCGNNEKNTNYGYTSNKSKRMKCSKCHTVFNIKNQPLNEKNNSIINAIRKGDDIKKIKHHFSLCNKKLSRILSVLSKYSKKYINKHNKKSDTIICTETFNIPYNNSNNKLFFIVSSNNATKKVMLVTNNLANKGELSSLWSYDSTKKEIIDNDKKLKTIIKEKEKYISLRSAFYDVDYGTSSLNKRNSGTIIKPVYLAYRHFQLLKLLTKSCTSITHSLCHESFIYAACISSYSELVTEKRCHIYYTYTLKKTQQSKTMSYKKTSLKLDNYWKDTWNIIELHSYDLAICNLTKSKTNMDISNLTLFPCHDFVSFIKSHPFYSQLSKLSPRNVSCAIDILTEQYNENILK